MRLSCKDDAKEEDARIDDDKEAVQLYRNTQ
jgi:hypothetical protein